MAKLTRRGFLQTSAGAAGAAAGATAIGAIGAGGLSALMGSSATAAEAASTDSIVAYVRSGATGEVNVMVGNREITTRDPELVRRLVKATQ